MACPNCSSPLSKRDPGFFRDSFTCLVCGFTSEALGTGLTWASAISAFVLGLAGSENFEPGHGDHRTD